MYEYETRIRYTEADPEGKMKLNAIADCFQSVFHFEGDDRNLGTDYFLAKNQGWFINFWQINIDDYPRYGENVIIGTFSYEDKGNTEGRNFYIKSKSGEILVKANSIWSLVDLSELQILRIPEEIINSNHYPRLEMNYLKRRIRYDKSLEAVEIGTHIVNSIELDSNNHLNNSEYIKIALVALADYNFTAISQICIEYKKQAVKGDLIKIYMLQDEGIILDLKSEEGISFATIRLKTELRKGEAH